MKKFTILYGLLFFTTSMFSQVGINTTSPFAQLEIKSTNQATPSNTDGILIPKIDAFPLTNPTAAQNSMMVYLTNDLPGKPKGFYYWDNGSSTWKGFGGNAGWELLGNSGTDPNVNFIGTKDANDVVFRRDNVISGKIGMANTSFGRSSLNPLNSGIYNSAFGLSSLANNTSGNSNSAFGNYSLFNTSSGNFNTAVGSNSMYSNTIGIQNTAMGSSASELNSTGNNNSSLGHYALYNNISGSNNTAVGLESLYTNLGSSNTALGYRSGYTTTTGTNNITVGANATIPTPAASDQMSIGNVLYGANMSATASGKIGIGVPTPSEKLEVAGKTKTTDLQVTTGASAGKVLTSDAVGNATWQNLSLANAWSITGNAGTTVASNFIGTTDNTDLLFKRNNLRSGLLNSSANNTSFGVQALNAVSSGNDNTAFGKASLALNTTGASNSSLGSGAMLQNTTGSFNTATGTSSLAFNTTGISNTATGTLSLFSNSTGNYNTAVGSRTLYTNTSGAINTAIGDDALSKNNDGNFNVAIGGSSMLENISGDDNVAIGRWSLFNNLVANQNTAVGAESLYGNTGALNTAIGYQAGNTNTSGSNNITIGAGSNVSVAAASNQMSIGNVIYGTAMNSATVALIGINEPAPNAKLQINASSQINPNNSDGIIIPRINTFPIINPGLAQNGMLVFLTTPANQSGFYYWDNPTTAWKPIATSQWTTSGANISNNNIGNVGIGTGVIAPSSLLTVKGNSIGFTQEDSSGVSKIGFFTNAGGAWLQTHSDTNLSFATNDGATQMVLEKTTGNLGIGTITPSEKLDVIGKTKTTSFQMTTGAGLNRFMMSDALGNGLWQAPNTALDSFSWSTTGNTSINPAVNFIGTINDSDLIFKRGGIKAGMIDQRNTSLGVNALLNTEYNAYSALIGYNTAIGMDALKENTTGAYNTACGYNSLSKNTTSLFNVAIGADALSRHSFNNGGAIYLTNNVAIGANALEFNNPTSTTTGKDNVAVGFAALGQNTSGSNNTANGFSALFSNTTGDYNSATGHNALYKINGQENTANGVNAMTNATSGNYNTVIGTNSLYTNTGSSTNTTLGHSTLFSNVSGSGNVAIGYQAGYSELGSNKLYIENSNSTTPLIYGEFDNNLVRINGRLNGIYTQLTANGDSQSSIFGYRNRDSQNDGTNYSLAGTNRAVSGHNLWGDLYTFGVTGHSDNDFTRTGGVLGSITGGTYWSSLGYKNSAATAYGVYATAALTVGTGRMSQPQNASGIGGGFYGDMIGSWSKGTVIGQVSSGTMFASYNSGDEYTAGKQIEIVATGNSKTAAYMVTSTESLVYKKGKINLVNGAARVNFDENYSNLLGETPVVTTTPMGQCNGLYIESIDKDGFVIKELNNGTSNVSVSWIAVGDRIDAKQNKIPKAVLENDFDNNINEVMFNENNKTETAKAMWFQGNNIQFGQLPSEFIHKSTDKKE